MERRIRIVIADDHPIFLNGLKHLIQDEQEFELVGEASNGVRAFQIITAEKPDLAIVDVSMPGLNGIALAKRIASERLRIQLIALTAHEDRAYVMQCLQVGMRGYLIKRSLADNLLQAIHAVVAGGTYIDPAVAAQVVAVDLRISGTSCDEAEQLSDRESEVLKFIALGMTNKEIGQRLVISPKSVETYRARAMEKLGLRSRTELVRYAFIKGWLEPS